MTYTVYYGEDFDTKSQAGLLNFLDSFSSLSQI